MVWCLEIQFDMVILDRPMILQSIYQLYNHLSSRRFLTWDFFLNRYDALFLEAQINLEKVGEVAVTRDLKNSNINSEVFQRKLNRAHEALALTHSSRSLAASFGAKWPYKRAMSAPGGMISKQDKLDKEKIYSRQSSAPVLKRKSSKLSSSIFSGGPSMQHFPNSFFPDGHLRELVQEETQFVHVIHRVMDLEDHDRDTLHLLIFLLMQFLSRPDVSHPTEEKAMGRNQHIVIRHLNILLGFSPAEKGFLISPLKLRGSPVFNAFMVMMSKVLDYNFKMGNIMLNIFLPVLTYCPSPQRFAHEHQSPTYSLWLLSSHVRHSWLLAVLVILYKYQYTTPPLSRQVQMLIHIVLNTLEAQCHRCKHLPEPLLSPVPSRSRDTFLIDLSTASVDLENIHERQTPPSDAGFSTNEFKFIIGDTTLGENKLNLTKISKDDSDLFREHLQRTPKEIQQWKARKMAEFSCSSDGEDIEPELEAIPESPKSESSDPEKSESVGELETLLPLSVGQARARIIKDALLGEERVTIVNQIENISSIATIVIENRGVEGLMTDQLMSFQASYVPDETPTDEFAGRENPAFLNEKLDESFKSCIPCFAEDINIELDDEDPSKQYKNFVNQLSVQLSRKEEKARSTLVEMEGDNLTITTESGKPKLLASQSVTKDVTYQSTAQCNITNKSSTPTTRAQEQFCQPIRGDPISSFCSTTATSTKACSSFVSSKSTEQKIKCTETESNFFIFPPVKLSGMQGFGTEKSTKKDSSVKLTLPILQNIQPKATSSPIKTEYKMDETCGSTTPRSPRSPKPRIQRMGAVDVGSLKGKSEQTKSVKSSPVSLRKDTASAMSNQSAISSKLSQSTQMATFSFLGLKEPQSSIDGLMTKPIPERLLPIGPQRKDSKKAQIEKDRAAVNAHRHLSAETSLTFVEPKESDLQLRSSSDVNKAVQTSKHFVTTGLPFEIPAQERLLPVGPLPYRKDLEGQRRAASPTKMLHKLGKQDSFAMDEPKGPFIIHTKPFEPVITKVIVEKKPIEKKPVEKTKSMDDKKGLISIIEKKLVEKTKSYEEKKGTLSIFPYDFKETLFKTNSLDSHPPAKMISLGQTKGGVKPYNSKTSSSIIEAPLLHKPPLSSGGIDSEEQYSGSTASSSTSKGTNQIRQEEHRVEPSANNRFQIAALQPKSSYEINCRTATVAVVDQIISEFAAMIIPETATMIESIESHPILELKTSGGSVDFAMDKNEAIEDRDDDDSGQRSLDQGQSDDLKGRLHYRQRKQRKSAGGEIQKTLDIRSGTARRARKADLGSTGNIAPTSKRSSTSQSSSARCVEDQVLEHCNDCGAITEEYSDEELGLCIVVLATFVHREPTLAAPLLPEMLRAVARIAATISYPWQCESNVYLPGGAGSVARQFLRCVLHQLTPNGIFVQLFNSHCGDVEFFKTISAALADFNDLNQVSPLLLLFENLNERKHLNSEAILLVMENVATYLECLPLESNNPPWGTLLPLLETFLRKLLLILTPGQSDLSALLRIIISVLKMPVITSCKQILDPFSKILSHCLQNSPIQYQQLIEITHLCNRGLLRERDKLTLSRTAIYELIQVLKFKSLIPDETLLILVQFLLQDAGGTLVPTIIVEFLPQPSNDFLNMCSTGASDCMRQHLNDALEFVADVHTLSKVKSNFHGTLSRLNEETLGGQLKAGMAQYLALEITKGNGRDNRAIGKYLPWLYHPPTAMQQGPKEFIECVAHIRLLSWLLLGALQHSALLHNVANFVCQPIPLEANSHIAEHIQVILAGFAEQSKASVLHMSSLFHAFILCQLWTMYCEHMVVLNPPGSEQNHQCSLTLTDFWAKVTPAILQLVCHSRVLAEMVSLHFLSLIEALMECNSTVLARLLPMWSPVLYSYHGQVNILPGHLQVRLQTCLNWQPPIHTREEATSITSTFLKWLQRLQFKLSQIELQSSAATQFYSM